MKATLIGGRAVVAARERTADPPRIGCRLVHAGAASGSRAPDGLVLTSPTTSEPL
jgi:hypothetical protein